MGDAAAAPEKALIAGKGAVDELVDQDEIAGRQSSRSCRTAESAGYRDAAGAQRIDIGAERDRRRAGNT